jgi:hypothetical protein
MTGRKVLFGVLVASSCPSTPASKVSNIAGSASALNRIKTAEYNLIVVRGFRKQIG